MMQSRDARKLFARLKKANPTPTTELRYSSVFELLISVILSAQATDIGVNKATAGLFKQANTPEKILALGEQGLKKHISSIGLFNTKAQNIIATCQILLKKHNGNIPRTREELEALPGVGRKTANVVLNTAFGYKTIAVDTHVFRLANRTGLAPGKTVLEVEKQLMKNVPETYLQYAHHWLILHGRYICKAINPSCKECALSDICAYNLARSCTKKNTESS